MILIAQEHFTLGNALDRLSGSLLIFPAAVLWLSHGTRSVGFVAATHALLSLAVLVAGIGMLGRLIPRGSHRLSLQERRLGGAFWLSSGVSYLREHILIVIVQPVVTPQALAAFDALGALFRGFEIARQPLSSMMVVDLTRTGSPPYLRRTLEVAAAAVTAGAAALVFVPLLLHPLYAGRYDESVWMTPWLAVYHAAGWLYTVPSGYLFGRASDFTLRRFVWIKVVFSLLTLAGGVLLTYQVGFTGFLFGLTAAGLTQTLLGYLFLITGARVPSSVEPHPARGAVSEE